jgi:hypothetical protein
MKSKAVIQSYIFSCSGTKPTREYGAGFFQGSTPNNLMAPELGFTFPIINLNSVDFPAPFIPRMPVTPPEIPKDTEFRAFILP